MSIGIETDIHVLGHIGLFAGGYVLLAIAGKVVGCGIGGLLMKFKPREALQIGVGMVPRMEVALIMANIGLREEVFDRGTFSIPVSMVIITTLVSPSS